MKNVALMFSSSHEWDPFLFTPIFQFSHIKKDQEPSNGLLKGGLVRKFEKSSYEVLRSGTNSYITHNLMSYFSAQ